MKQEKFISNWLFATAFLVFCLVIVGGATRLTGSGLSITEWKPVMGVFPPLSHEAWLVEFEKYKQISQYKMLNKGMELSTFKVIYFWEWGHRLLARFIGLFLLLPFLYFTFTKKITTSQSFKIFGIGLLIGLQGFVGWLMVASGLVEGMTAVAPLKLMLHLTLAAIIFALLIKVAMEFRSIPRLTHAHSAILRGLFVQIALGALVAGNHAGLIYNTFPHMTGMLDAITAAPITLNSFIDNHALVQFNHRLVAFALLFHVGFYTWKKRVTNGLFYAYLGQVCIGIATLVYVVPFSLAMLHQAYAFALIALTLLNSRKFTP